MTRLTKAQFLKRQRWDVNAELAFEAGEKARIYGLKLSDCPKFERYGEPRATQLKVAWAKGWNVQNKKLDSWLPYKEEA